MLSDFRKDEYTRDTAKIYIGSRGDFIEIKPFTDKKFDNARSLAFKRNKQAIKKDKLSSGQIQRALAPIYAKYLLVDWQMTDTVESLTADFPDIKVKPVKDDETLAQIPFNYENALKVLSHESYLEFLNFVTEQSNEAANFISEDKEEDSKN